MCDRMQWVKAKHAATASQFVRALLVGVFDAETLLVSNLKGGSNKRDTTASSKKALDSDYLSAIYGMIQPSLPVVRAGAN